MAIDKPWDDDAAARVDRLRAGDVADIGRYAPDDPGSDQNVGAIEIADLIVHRQNDGVLDEDFTRTHGRLNNSHAIARRPYFQTDRQRHDLRAEISRLTNKRLGGAVDAFENRTKICFREP